MDNEVVTATKTGGMEHKIIPGLTSIIMPIYLHDYSLFHYTGNAIGAVHEHTDPKLTPYEIVLVDNGSPIKLPNPQSYLVDKYVRNEENEGVTKAWNKGMRISQGEYICLLNNDTMVFDYWLDELQTCLDHVDLVMATPMYGEPFARWKSARAKWDEWSRKPVQDSFSDFKDFSCVLAKRLLFEEVGLFDESYYMYAQDTDLFRRMDEKGKKYKSTKRVPTFHIIGATSTSLAETPHQMNQDKDVYKQKWSKPKEESMNQQPTHPNPSPSVSDLPPEQPKEYTAETMPELIRTKETGDKMYFVENGITHWVTNPKVLEGLGFGFGDEVMVSRLSFLKLKSGEPITTFNMQEYKREKA